MVTQNTQYYCGCKVKIKFYATLEFRRQKKNLYSGVSHNACLFIVEATEKEFKIAESV